MDIEALKTELERYAQNGVIGERLRLLNFPSIRENSWIYAGTFFPWHKGHEYLVATFHKTFPNEILIVMPDRNPFKAEMLSAQTILVELLSNNVAKSSHIDPSFLLQEKSNPTIDWIQKIPFNQRNLVMGGDSFVSLPKWKEAEKLVNQLNRLFVVAREEEERERTQTYNWCLELNPRLEITVEKKNPHKQLASSKIRN